MTEGFKFFGVYVPSDFQCENSEVIFSNCESALKYCKQNRKARFKGFNSENEAIEFSKNGSFGGSGNPYCPIESLSFKSLKSEDMFKLRTLIEKDDYEAVEQLIWKNPRYLISEGDGATILQEGPRYNALHICARFQRTNIAELILNTVSDSQYIEKLYGVQDENKYTQLSSILIDSLLNTPDKSLNETPLHFATKFGALDMVKIFISYPQCQKNRVNKCGQKPTDITCARYSPSDPIMLKLVKEEINNLLEDGYLIPVWRSPNNELPPIIGDPFSPPFMPSSPTKSDRLSPTMEIVALAGPMKYEDAVEFRKKWKMPGKNTTPRRLTPSPIKYVTPHPSKAILIRPGTVDMDKNVEKAGRDLAKKLNVKWKEQWCFLKMFIDLRTEKGLQALEEYLKSRFTSTNSGASSVNVSSGVDSQIYSFENVNRDVNKSNPLLKPYNYLCSKFKFLSLKQKTSDSTEIFSTDSQQSWTNNFVECFCMNFSVRVVEKIKEYFSNNSPTDDCLKALLEETEKLLKQINEWQRAEHSETFPFESVYTKSGELISERLKMAADDQAQYAIAVLDLFLNNSTLFSEDRSSSSACKLYSSSNLNVVLKIFRRISEELINCLTSPVNSKEESVSSSHIENEETPKSSSKYASFKDKFRMVGSNLQIKNNEDCAPKTPISKKLGTSLCRRISFSDGNEESLENHEQCDMDDKDHLIFSSSGCDVAEVTSNITKNYDSENSDENKDTDDFDDEFVTPHGSEYGSDDEMNDVKAAKFSDNEMDDAEEGPDIFLIGEHGSNLDIIIYDILMETVINEYQYPFTYRWRHSMNLYIDKLRQSSSYS